jgi:hypothetical protein
MHNIIAIIVLLYDMGLRLSKLRSSGPCPKKKPFKIVLSNVKKKSSKWQTHPFYMIVMVVGHSCLILKDYVESLSTTLNSRYLLFVGIFHVHYYGQSIYLFRKIYHHFQA